MPHVFCLRRARLHSVLVWCCCWLILPTASPLDSLAAQDRTTATEKSQRHSIRLLKTVAESSGYRATASGADCELFLRRLERLWPACHLESLGETVEGRTIWGLVVEPEDRQSPDRLNVLLLGGIHSGECDGKEALLALARDYASGQRALAWERLRLIFVPNFNADANERVGIAHRPEQVGPELGMGLRENAQGLDLNRDFVKLETPEVRALVAALNRYDVDVLIDTHTTNGSLHRYDLTYDVPHHPALGDKLDRWLRTELLPTVTKSLESQGLSTFYYGNFDSAHARWQTFGHEPRHSTELMGLRGKIGILVESYAYATYQRRVEATTEFVDEVLGQLAQHSPAVRQLLTDEAKDQTPGMSLPVRAELAVTATDDEVIIKGYQRPGGGRPPAPPFSAKSLADLEPHDYRVELWSSARATQLIELPHAYAVAPQYAWALSRLHLQGIKLQRTHIDLESVQCESLLVREVKKSEVPLQQHSLRRVTVEAQTGKRMLPSGTYLVRTSQPLGVLAAYLLEPESDDGLAAWNFFDPDLRSEAVYPVLRVLEDLPAGSATDVDRVEPGEQLTLEHIMQPGHNVEYSTSSDCDPAWLGDKSDLVLRRDERWFVVDPATGSRRECEWIAKMQTALASIVGVKPQDAQKKVSPGAFSSDAKFGLLSHEQDLFFYDLLSDRARQLTHSPKEAEEQAELSPTGKHAAYVVRNDLYVVDCQSSEVRRLTKDGSADLLNGILDWVYQEEVYGRGNFRAFWFSPDGRRLAFLQLDQSPVLHYKVSDSIAYRQQLEDTRYPKAGDPLPIARVWIADVESGELREVDLRQFPPDDRLVVRVTWSPDNQLWLQIQNRIQTEQVVVRVDADNGQSTRMLEEKSPGWIEVLGQPKFLPDGSFLWLSDLPGGRRRLWRFDVPSRQLKQLTSGEWDVAELQSVSPDGRTAFVTGNLSHPSETQLISVDTNSGETAQVTSEPGVHRPRMSPNGRYFIDTWSSLDRPPVTVLESIDGKTKCVLEAPVSDRYRYVAMARPHMRTIPARDGVPLQAMVLLPADVESRSQPARLPVLFYVYGGPQAPTVHNSWQGGNFWWHQYLCNQGYAVVLCDNRASRGHGIADTWKIRRDMGKVELEDLEDAVQWVCDQPWADSERIGLWGWSYGGYFTAYALTHSQLFKAGIAGAPVTDWHNYDAIYTERYMDLPEKNPDGYKSSSTISAAKNLHGRLLLIHGERDDNVHISNTLQLAYALQKAGKPFDMMIYPKNRHGVTDPAQKYHLYRTMTEFLERELKH